MNITTKYIHQNNVYLLSFTIAINSNTAVTIFLFLRALLIA